jgi:hypothetical protein
MEAIFSAVPKRGKLIFDNTIDLEDYCIENDEVDLVVSVKHASKLSQKQKMYNFLYGPILDYSITAFSAQGYELMDKVKAIYMLKAEFGKEIMYNSKTKKEEIYLIELSKASKARLLKFIQDCIFFLESELGQRVPSSEEYKEMKLKEKKK